MSAQSGRRTSLLVVTAAILTLAVLATVVWGTMRLGADDWKWPRIADPLWSRALVPTALLVLLGGCAMAVWRRIEGMGPTGEVTVVAGFVCIGAALQIAMMRQPPAGFHEAVMAIAQPGANRYHKAARGVESLGAVLGNYPAWMRDDSHALVITNPGGPLAVFWSLNHVFAGNETAAREFVRDREDTLTHGVRLDESPWAVRLFQGMTQAEVAGAWLAALVLPVVASLAAIPAYLLARIIYGRREAVLAATFSLVVPSVLLFSPGLDQCYPVLATGAAWLAYGAGRRRSTVMAASFGLVVSVGLFFSLAFAVVVLLAGLLGAAGLLRATGHVSLTVAARLVVVAVAGFALPVVLLQVVTGYPSVAVWQGCLEANAEFNAVSQRGYWTWLLLNPIEFVAFLGVPAACLLGWRVFGTDRLPAVLVVALLVVLNLLGLNRGEVARLWLFLMPVCVAIGVAEIERAAPYRRVVFLVLFALQAGQAVVFRAVLKVLNIV